MSWKTAIVVGGTNGIGAEIARQLAARGCRVAVVGRDEAALQSFSATCLTYRHDVVADRDHISELFQRITGDLGGLDLIVYSSGIMVIPGSDEYPTASDIATIDVNLSGAIAWFNEAAIRFGNVRRGTIVGLSSVAGDRGRKLAPAYHASKAGLTTYLESLRNRLAPLGVRVTTIKPGPVATRMVKGHPLEAKAMPVDVAAAKILRLAKSGRERYLSPVHWIIFTVLRHVPSPLFRRLKV